MRHPRLDARRARPVVTVLAHDAVDATPAAGGVRRRRPAPPRPRGLDGARWCARNEDRGTSWDEVAADPDLAPLVDARSTGTAAHSALNALAPGQQTAMLRPAGLGAVAPVWQRSDDVELVAVR